MADIAVTEGKELSVGGAPTIVYDKIRPMNLTFHVPNIGGPVYCDVNVRKYRVLEDGTKEDGPLQGDSVVVCSLGDLTQVLGAIEGGADLMVAVEGAILNLAKAKGYV